jgi:hypothetical protein
MCVEDRKQIETEQFTAVMKGDYSSVGFSPGRNQHNTAAFNHYINIIKSEYDSGQCCI